MHYQVNPRASASATVEAPSLIEQAGSAPVGGCSLMLLVGQFRQRLNAMSARERDDSLDYFAVQGALDRVRLEGLAG